MRWIVLISSPVQGEYELILHPEEVDDKKFSPKKNASWEIIDLEKTDKVNPSVSDPDSFLRIRILDCFPNPDPGNKKTNFSKAKTKFWENFCFQPKK